MSTLITLGLGALTAEQIEAVARHRAPVAISAEARAAMDRSRAVVDRLAHAAEPVYGVSTGFGAMASRHIAPEDRRRLQAGLIRSHAAGMGAPVEREVVRATMLLRARTLTTGYTGARPAVAERLVDLLNHGLTPVVPQFGSLGCSGDLAPLAHIALALMGEGPVEIERQGDGERDDASGERDGAGGERDEAGGDAAGHVIEASTALASCGLEPLRLEAKEGLSLINGTDGMLGMLVLACLDAARLLDAADLTAAMSVEALLGTDQAFAADVVALRPQPGQQASAANLRAFLAGSAIVASHRHEDPRVQDAYSLRCTPQVHGAARDTLQHAERVAGYELAAAIDNPVVLPDGRLSSHGNFHGAPLALVADFLAIALADVASLTERRIDRLLDAHRSHGLPPFLADDPGVDSGLMIAHYTAASLAAECKRLAVPASVDSIPTSALQEDHVSMGWAACRKLRRVVALLARIVAVEAVTSGRGLDLRRPLLPAPATAAALARLRHVVPGPGPDRFLAPELAAAERLVSTGALLDAARSVT